MKLHMCTVWIHIKTSAKNLRNRIIIYMEFNGLNFGKITKKCVCQISKNMEKITKLLDSRVKMSK